MHSLSPTRSPAPDHTTSLGDIPPTSAARERSRSRARARRAFVAGGGTAGTTGDARSRSRSASSSVTLIRAPWGWQSAGGGDPHAPTQQQHESDVEEEDEEGSDEEQAQEDELRCIHGHPVPVPVRGRESKLRMRRAGQKRGSSLSGGSMTSSSSASAVKKRQQQQPQAPPKKPEAAQPTTGTPATHPPGSFLARLPLPLSYFLGYRPSSSPPTSRTGRIFRSPLVGPVRHLPAILETYLFAFLGAFLSLASICVVFSKGNAFAASATSPPGEWTTPIVIGSFGASSVILFATPASPVGQPWNFVVGQILSALSGIIMARLFSLAGPAHYNIQTTDFAGNVDWICGGLASALAIVLMQLCDAIHPPGGATALLAATTPAVERLSWRYLVIVLISSGIMLAWAMLWLNLGRKRYPTQWAPAQGPNSAWDIYRRAAAMWRGRAERKREGSDKGDVEKQEQTPSSSSNDTHVPPSSATAQAPHVQAGGPLKPSTDPVRDGARESASHTQPAPGYPQPPQPAASTGRL